MASLISGGGSTMCEVAKACLSGRIQARFSCVIASNAQARGLQRAKDLGVPAQDIVVVDPREYIEPGAAAVNAQAFGAALLRELRARDISIVLQNGWLPLTPLSVIEAFPQRIFNQHPGPVPEFGGAGMFGRRVHAAVLLFRRLTKTEPWSEVIAQRVGVNFDEGAVLKAKRVPILPGDTVEDLQSRALPLEHQTQIELLKDLAEGRELAPVIREPIVKPEHEEIWQTARRAARLLYPKG